MNTASQFEQLLGLSSTPSRDWTILIVPSPNAPTTDIIWDYILYGMIPRYFRFHFEAAIEGANYYFVTSGETPPVYYYPSPLKSNTILFYNPDDSPFTDNPAGNNGYQVYGGKIRINARLTTSVEFMNYVIWHEMCHSFGVSGDDMVSEKTELATYLRSVLGTPDAIAFASMLDVTANPPRIETQKYLLSMKLHRLFPNWYLYEMEGEIRDSIAVDIRKLQNELVLFRDFGAHISADDTNLPLVLIESSGSRIVSPITMEFNETHSVKHSYRQVIPASKLNISSVSAQIRIRLAAGSYTHVSIMERDLLSFGAAPPTEITFNGGQSGCVVAPGPGTWSDWVDFQVIPGKDYLITFDQSAFSTYHWLNQNVGYGVYHESNCESWNIQRKTYANNWEYVGLVYCFLDLESRELTLSALPSTRSGDKWLSDNGVFTPVNAATLCGKTDAAFMDSNTASQLYAAKLKTFIRIVDMHSNTPPEYPNHGDFYMVNGVGTGVWSVFADKELVKWDGYANAWKNYLVP